MVVKPAFTWVPSVCTVPTMTAAMRATSRPYSTPAAPFSSAKKLWMRLVMCVVPLFGDGMKKVRAARLGGGQRGGDGGEAGLHLGAERLHGTVRIPTKPGHPFRFKGGHVFRSEAGHHSDLMAAGVASSRRVTCVVSRSADVGQVGA